MGINGLLRNTKSVGQKKHISDYRNKTVAVDGYSWMHKALYKCSLEVFTDKNIDGIIQYFAKRISYFLKLKIKVVLVFDGDDLPLKQMTNSKRKGNRQQKMKQAQEYLKNDDLDQARKLLAISLDVTPDMVYTLKQHILEQFPIKVEFLVAPYEADSQLAYLSKIKYIDLVISEDSDLIVFGAQEIFYKMDKHFYGVVYNQKDLKYCEEMNLCNWSFDKFIQMCILSGCDYLSSPKGVGLKTAYQLFNKYNNIDKVVDSLKNNLEDQYYNKFLYAYLAFKYSRVFCPIKKQIVPLNPQDVKDINLENSFDLFATKKAKKILGNFNFLGIDNGQKISNQIAYCEIHPVSKKEFQQIYKSKQSKGQINYYKRKLNHKLKQAISIFQSNKQQPGKLKIKEVVKYDYYSQQNCISSSSNIIKKSLSQQKIQITSQNQSNNKILYNDLSSSLIKSKSKITKISNEQKNEEKQITQKVSTKKTIDYDKFLEEFLEENRKLKIDCAKILNIFQKSSKLQKNQLINYNQIKEVILQLQKFMQKLKIFIMFLSKKKKFNAKKLNIQIKEKQNKQIKKESLKLVQIKVDKSIFQSLEFFGFVFKKTILVKNRFKQEFYLLDQHAVHERIRYEYFLDMLLKKQQKEFLSLYIKNKKNPQIKEIQLNLEQQLDDKQISQFNYFQKKYQFLKIEFTIKNKIIYLKKTLSIGNQIYDLQLILQDINKQKENQDIILPYFIHNYIKQVSCKNAIKFNDVLNKQQAQQIITDLKLCQFPMYCIHGRNTIYPINILKNINEQINYLNIQFNIHEKNTRKLMAISIKSNKQLKKKFK